MKSSFCRLSKIVFALIPALLVGCKPQRPQKQEQKDIGAGIAIPKPAPASPESRKEIAVTETLNANDHEKIRAAVEKTVAVRGKVHHVGGTAAGGVYFIIFQGNQRGQFVGIVKKENFTAVTEALGADLKPGLAGKTVELRGKMELYKDNTPQIVVSGGNQIRLVEE